MFSECASFEHTVLWVYTHAPRNVSWYI